MELFLIILAVCVLLLAAIITERRAERKLEPAPPRKLIVTGVPRRRGVDRWEW